MEPIETNPAGALRKLCMTGMAYADLPHDLAILKVESELRSVARHLFVEAHGIHEWEKAYYAAESDSSFDWWTKIWSSAVQLERRAA